MDFGPSESNIRHAALNKLRLKEIPRIPIIIVIVLVLASIYPLKLVIDLRQKPEFTDLVKHPEIKEPWMWKPHTLPDYIDVESYDLEFWFDKDLFNFTGRTVIDFSLRSHTPGIVLHSQTLQVVEVQLVKDGMNATSNQTHFPIFITYDKEYDFILLTFNETLDPGNYSLDIKYYGLLRESKNAGIVYSLYTSCNGAKEHLLYTHFYPMFARRAFPCFDEPRFKSTFQLRLNYMLDYSMVLSNTKILSNTSQDNVTKVVFKKTPIMSTHLLAFALGNYERYSTNNGSILGTEFDMGTQHDAEISLWTDTCKINYTKLSYEIACVGIDWMSNYTAFEYPLEKFDMVDIPNLSREAVGNWGIIFFKSSSIVIDDPTNPSFYSLSWVSSSILNQVVYQWVGGLVTCSSWTEAWVSIGLTEYVPYLLLRDLFPTWNMSVIFYSEETITSMFYDRFNSSVPLLPDNSTQAITTTTTGYLRAKAAIVTRNIIHTIGFGNFRIALRRYIDKYQYSTAASNNLLDEYSIVYQGNITEFMDPWIRKRGYPIVTYRVRGGNLRGFQKRYIPDINSNDTNNDDAWWLPLTYRSVRGDVPTQFTSDRSFEVTQVSMVSWFKANIDATGYYLVNYPDENWLKLSTEIRKNPEILSEADRAQFVVDAFSLAESGDITYYTAVMTATRCLESESSIHVWAASFSVFRRLSHFINRLSCFGYYQDFLTELLLPQLDQLSWTEDYEDQNIRQRRSSLFAFAAGHIRKERRFYEPALRLWKKFLEDPINNLIDVSIRRALWIIVSKLGSHKDWHTMFSLFLNSTNPFDAERYIHGLAFTNDGYLIKYLLSVSLDSTLVDTSTQLRIIQRVAENPNGMGLHILWEFTKENWDELSKNDEIVLSLLRYFAKFNTEIKLQDVQEQFSQVGPTNNNHFKLALDEIVHNINWIETYGDVVCNLLTDRFDNTRSIGD